LFVAEKSQSPVKVVDAPLNPSELVNKQVQIHRHRKRNNEVKSGTFMHVISGSPLKISLASINISHNKEIDNMWCPPDMNNFS
jgi:hypothetical protein